MQAALAGTMAKAEDAVSQAISSNRKLSDMKRDTIEPTSSQKLTSDWGVRQDNTDVWLSASSEERQGPLLLEDGFAREKV